MRTPLTPLGGTEMEVLREVWALGQATARDVHDRITARRRLAYTTVMTVMKNLAEKGYLQYEPQGTAYVYSAAGPGARGLIVAVPPGLSFTVVRPRCSARSAYSPLGSAIAIQRPPGPVP